MHKRILIMIFFLLPLYLSAQVRFNKVYLDSTSISHSGLVTVDDGYIICGEVYKNGYRNITFVKTDLWGEVLWRKYYGKQDEIFYTGIDNCFFKLQQGGFALVGCHVNESDTLYRKTLLMVMDENCDTIFTKKYTVTDNYQYALGGIQTSDKGFALAGIIRSYEPDTNTINAFLIRTDSLGNKIWHNSYGGASTDHFYCVAETADSGLIVGGRSFSFNNGNLPCDWYLVRTDTEGNQIWQDNYGNTQYDDGPVLDLIKTSDGNYIITGIYTYHQDIPSDFLGLRARIIKIDDMNNVYFDKTYSEYVDYQHPIDSSTCWFMGITETKDSSLAAICRIMRLDNTQFNKLYLMNFFGDTLFTRVVESPDDSVLFTQEYLEVIESTDDGGYVMAGIATSAFVLNTLWLVKTDSCGFYGEADAGFTYSVEEFEVLFCNNSKHADSCIWDFGDSSFLNSAIGLDPVHTYADTGNYVVTLEAYNSCYPEVRDTFSVEIHVSDVGIAENMVISEINLYPNPADNTVTIESETTKPKEIEIYNMLGENVFNAEFSDRTETIDCSVLIEGIYIIRIKDQQNYINKRLVISR